MPEVPTTLLFLGDRSPYGLSVARAVLASGLPLRGVIVPSREAWDRQRARTLNAAKRSGLGGQRLVRRAGARARRAIESQPPRDIPGGEPLPPLVLDPGATSGELERACLAAGVAWRSTDGTRSESFLSDVRRDAPTLILSAGFPIDFPRALLEIPSSGAINFHPSLLPRCRGSHPVFWTLASGETQGGVTAHFMTQEIDAGNIVAQIPLPLSDQDDYGSLYRRAMEASPVLVGMVERFLVAGGGEGERQDDARATRFREDTEDDHRISWEHRSPSEIVALTRTGEAFATFHGNRVGILKAREHHTVARERRKAQPGSVLAVSDETFAVAASGGVVDIQYVSWRGLGYGAGTLGRAIGVRRGEVFE